MKINNLATPILFCLLGSFNIYAAEKCSNTLDQYYTQLPSWLSQQSSSNALDMSCVKHSMNAFRGWAQSLGHDNSGNEGLFIYCSEEQTKRSPLPQCQTEAYLNTTLNTYNNVTDCLDIEIGDLYSIVAAESGFYHNSISSSAADFGFGQVTTPAITDANIQWYNFIDQMKASSKKSCQNIIKYIEENNIEPVYDNFSCTLTEAPKNPLLNALYAGFHFKIIAGYMENYSRDSLLQKRLERILNKSFTLERYAEIKSVLKVLSYNMGHVGTTNALEQFLLEKEHDLEVLKEERHDISNDLGRINLQILRGSNTKLLEQKEKILKELNSKDQEIAIIQTPSLFNGDEETPGSFGEYLVSRKMSYYLRVLNKRIKYIAKRDKENLCPTEKFLHIQ
ncbi:MAG: hypothetical protein K9K67_15265 [Bacteriovoracaceae bacterium]|nr:hypothetical protein [Bacteriovoracaceae bacterium]